MALANYGYNLGFPIITCQWTAYPTLYCLWGNESHSLHSTVYEYEFVVSNSFCSFKFYVKCKENSAIEIAVTKKKSINLSKSLQKYYPVHFVGNKFPIYACEWMLSSLPNSYTLFDIQTLGLYGLHQQNSDVVGHMWSDWNQNLSFNWTILLMICISVA